MSIRGWVYIIENDAMPGLVKVGYSTKDPALRAKELDNTGVPHPYRVVYDALVRDPRQVEQQVHAALVDYKDRKEWFKCTAFMAHKIIRKVAKEILLEQLPPEFTEENSEPPSHEPPRNVCQMAGCKMDADRNYKGSFYCDRHYSQLRRERFNRLRPSQ